ncbi:hypothetical protein DWC19_02325 [Streptomyces sp. M7]|nr:hypothetical protein DWC19_02325 [Streptomyces sp. M7]
MALRDANTMIRNCAKAGPTRTSESPASSPSTGERTATPLRVSDTSAVMPSSHGVELSERSL